MMIATNTVTKVTQDTRFDMLGGFTKGRPVTVGDHKWEPITSGIVKYTYRDREPVEIDVVEAAKSAG